MLDSNALGSGPWLVAGWRPTCGHAAWLVPLALALSAAASVAQEPRAEDAPTEAVAAVASLARTAQPAGIRAQALAELALSAAKAGLRAPATALGREAGELAASTKPWAEDWPAAAVALVRLASVRSTLGEPDAPAAFLAAFEAAGVEPRSLVGALSALADAGPGDFIEPCVTHAVAIFQRCPPRMRADLLGECAGSLGRCGGAKRAAGLAAALLEDPHVELAALEELVAALPHIDRALAERAWARLRADALAAEELSEFVVRPLVACLREDVSTAWTRADSMAKELADRGDAYPAVLVRLAAVLAMRDAKHAAAGDRLREVLEAAWTLEDPIERLRVLDQLTPCVPIALPAPDALQLLGAELARALQGRLEPHVVSEHLACVARAARELPASEGVARLVAAVVDAALVRHAETRAAGGAWLFFEPLAEAARTAARLGDAGRLLLTEISRAAAQSLDELTDAERAHDSGGPSSWPALALVACAQALADRDGAAAERDLARALAAVARGPSASDQVELALAIASAPAGLGEPRALALRLTALVRGPGPLTTTEDWLDLLRALGALATAP